MISTITTEVIGSVRITRVDAKRLTRSLSDTAGKIRSEHPEVSNIILFGSFSKGTFTSQSDVDVAIIVLRSRQRFMDRPEVFMDYFSDIDVQVNVIVYTVQEFERLLKVGNRFVQEIQNGQRL